MLPGFEKAYSSLDVGSESSLPGVEKFTVHHHFHFISKGPDMR